MRMKRVVPYLKNKYVLTSLGFIVWLSFFDRNDVISQYDSYKRLKQLQKDRQYYIAEIQQNRKDMQNLISNRKNLEKYAREKYLMKKEEEEIFVFVEEPNK
jgi:cell division protein FtsB